MFLRRNLVTGATTVFRRSLLEHALPLPVEWVHDEWLGIIASAIGRVDLLEQPLIDYRQHESNQIGARRDTFEAKVRKALASRGNTHVERAIKAELLLARLQKIGGGFRRRFSTRCAARSSTSASALPCPHRGSPVACPFFAKP